MPEEKVGIDTRYYISGPVAWKAGSYDRHAWVEAQGRNYGLLCVHMDRPALLALRDELVRVFPIAAVVLKNAEAPPDAQ